MSSSPDILTIKAGKPYVIVLDTQDTFVQSKLGIILNEMSMRMRVIGGKMVIYKISHKNETDEPKPVTAENITITYDDIVIPECVEIIDTEIKITLNT